MPKPKSMKAGSPDDFQTIDPDAIACLAPYLPKTLIWEPACGEGFMANHLRSHGFKVLATDIKLGHDFIKHQNLWEPGCIVTNPPFSMKEKFMARCYEFGFPFALLMPISTFDSEERRTLMSKNGIELILPGKRLNFETPPQTKARKAGINIKKKSGAWFYSCWFTYGLNLGRQLVFTDADRFL